MELINSIFENYGLWFLLLIVFIAQLGIPIGSSFFLMWFGSTLDSASTLLIAILATTGAAILGDIAAYSLGKRFSRQLESLENRYQSLAKKAQQSRNLINTYGAWIIWVTRFLVTGLGPLVNYLLGSKQYSFKTFLLWTSFGEVLFTLELLYFGYHFKDSWEDLLAVISDMGWLIGLLILLAWLIKKQLKKAI